MNFQDGSRNSIQSLLAQLRSAQDEPSALPTIPQGAGSYNTAYSSNNPRSASSSNAPQVPSKRQLDDLLASLGQTPAVVSPSRKPLIEPFGPVSASIAAGPSRIPYDPLAPAHIDPTPPSTLRKASSSASASVSISEKAKGKLKAPAERVDEPGYPIMPFSKALPILSELLGEEAFRLELKKMKADQDALERRLWAKRERMKAEHEKSIQAEKDIAQIARRPISKEKEAEWSRALRDKSQTFYTENCLPAIDGLALRQRERLQQLGVPGLGGKWQEDEKARERVKRIMDVLEGSMDE